MSEKHNVIVSNHTILRYTTNSNYFFKSFFIPIFIRNIGYDIR
jgi:hypothetical protein